MIKFTRGILLWFGLLVLLLSGIIAAARYDHGAPRWMVFPDRQTGLAIMRSDNGAIVRHIAQRTLLYNIGAQPEWSPDGQWILFWNQGTGELYRIRPDGSDQTLLISTLTYIWSYRWSQDGQWIFYTATTPSGSSGLYRMRADGTAQRQLTDLSIRAGPEVSPDGHWLIFAADGVIYRMRSDGQNLSLITDSAWVLGLQWSPDGAWILYRVRAENLTSTLYLIRPDGTDQRLIAPPEEYAGDAQWSPDGQWIVFSANRSRMIYRIRPDGTDLQELTLTTDKSRSPQWSPDGERILYTDSEGLFWMRPDGSEPQLIAPSADAATVSWSPPIGLGWNPWRIIAAGIGLIGLAIFPWHKLRFLAGNPVGSR